MKPIFPIFMILWAASCGGPPCSDDDVREAAGDLALPPDCEAFDAGRPDGWRVLEGSWTVIDGEYRAVGASSTRDLQATLKDTDDMANLDLELSLRAVGVVDKLLLLRATSADDAIQINFRSAPFGDVVVQERTSGEQTIHQFFPSPSDVRGEPVRARVRLDGNHLTVRVDGGLVVDQEFPFAPHAGTYGLAAFNGVVTAFDDICVQAL